MEAAHDRARELVARSLGITESELQDDDGINSIPEWDSLAQLEIVIVFESTYNKQISDEDSFLALSTIAGIAQMIQRINEEQ